MAKMSIHRYAEILGQIGNDASSGVEELVRRFCLEYPGAPMEDIREFAIAVAIEALDTYSSASIYAADSLFDEMMLFEGAETLSQEGLFKPDTKGIVETAHYQVGKCSTTDEFAKRMGEAVSYYVRDAAGNEVMANVERANTRGGRKKQVRFARIPTGLETCSFCTMLASRGFDYLSAESAGHANHRGCNCLIVPGFKGETEVEGYDPDALKDRWKRFETIDRRGDLTQAERRMLKMAVLDEERPLDLEGSRELASLFDKSISVRKSRFLDELTQENYDATIGALLRDIGEIYGMRLSGEFACGPKLYSAVPDGFEIWATTRMRGMWDEVLFLHTDRRRKKGNPDLLVGGKYIDIKTPEQKERIGKRLNEAATQCHNRGQDEGIALLSPLQLRRGVEMCERVAQTKVNKGQIDRVYVLGANSSVSII